MIKGGAPYADSEGAVPTWFGICHGWAPASFMLPRPKFGVTVKSVEGQEIHFTPSDLKALGTLLWANGAGRTRFIGGRCNSENPPRDSNNRDTDPDCFDTNPATWHLAVVNQIGVAKRSFVMDASAANEVWNQPLLGYQYSYINPITRVSSRKVDDAKVKLKDWSGDPSAGHRSPKAEYVVQIVMSAAYMAENLPTTKDEDGPYTDSRAAQTYSYDLELDGEGNVVGGEWRSSIHPDFLWVPVPGSQASSRGDYWLSQRPDAGEWNVLESIPSQWQVAAKLSSAYDQPLAKIVMKLFEMSQKRN